MLKFRQWLQRTWWDDGSGGFVLVPLSLFFIIASAGRRLAYRCGLLRRWHPGIPVIVVGNITVGGAGKTPLVMWLANTLVQSGIRVGIVSRGYGARRAGKAPMLVSKDADADLVGDEPLLMALRTGVPVAISADRAAAAALMREQGVQVILSDDGLQHYALARDVEIAVVDGRRRFGNGRLLPAGPLREPTSRLDVVDAVVINGGEARGSAEIRMDLVGDTMVNILSGETRTLAECRGQLWHSVAGIGHPEQFFNAAEAAGLRLLRHPFPDHAGFQPEDFDFGDELPILMTEKDAVKCRSFADKRLWYLPVEPEIAAADAERLLAPIMACCRTDDVKTG
ncbi:MAG: tetraacyldisaccharide 4'-kinase [Gammaproteobacteria bacterium]